MRIRVEVEAPNRPAVLALLRAVADRLEDGEPGYGRAIGIGHREEPLPGVPLSHRATLEILEEAPRV